jgi:hypothetical protein
MPQVRACSVVSLLPERLVLVAVSILVGLGLIHIAQAMLGAPAICP